MLYFGLQFSYLRPDNTDLPDIFTDRPVATLRDRDTLVALEIAKSTDSRSSNLEIVGEKGQLWVDYQTDAVTLVQGTQRRILREPKTVYTIPLVLREFARAVREESVMPVSVEDGVRTLEVVDASYRSVQSGRPEIAAEAPPRGGDHTCAERYEYSRKR